MEYSIYIGLNRLNNIIGLNCQEEVLYPTHPLEDGTVFSDTSIIQPLMYNIDLLVTEGEYDTLRVAKKERQEIILFEGETYVDRLYISRINRDIGSDTVGRYPVYLALVEIFTVKSLFSEKKIIPSNKGNADTVKKGEVQGEAPPKSLAQSIFSSILGVGG